MNNLFFATIYLKTKASEKIDDFVPIYAVIGDVEQDKFISLDGKIYQNIRNCKKCGFENAIKISDWKIHSEKKEIEELLKEYASVCKKIFFLFLKDINLVIRYHESMLNYGVGHLLDLEEIKKKTKFRCKLQQYGIIAIDKRRKKEYTESGVK